MKARDQILDLKQRMGRSIIGQEAIIERHKVVTEIVKVVAVA